MNGTTPLSSPGLTGRPSIPETPAIESRSRGVLDRPVKPGDDSFVVAGVLPNPSSFLATRTPRECARGPNDVIARSEATIAPSACFRGYRAGSLEQGPEGRKHLGGVAQAGQEAVDAFEQRVGVLVELAGGDQN